jgi:hypothetical protein
MGDSEGEPRSFDRIEDDIRDAMKEYFNQMPDMKEVVIWGLCDAATAASFYVSTDGRARGLVLLNPWGCTPEGAARTMLREYCLARLGEVVFWNASQLRLSFRIYTNRLLKKEILSHKTAKTGIPSTPISA